MFLKIISRPLHCCRNVSGWLRLNDTYVFSGTFAYNVWRDTITCACAHLYIQMTILINSQAVAKHKLLRGKRENANPSVPRTRDINTFRIMFQFIRHLQVIFHDWFCSHSIIFTSGNLGNIKSLRDYYASILLRV